MDDINDEDFISAKKETETVKCICFALIGQIYEKDARREHVYPFSLEKKA